MYLHIQQECPPSHPGAGGDLKCKFGSSAARVKREEIEDKQDWPLTCSRWSDLFVYIYHIYLLGMYATSTTSAMYSTYTTDMYMYIPYISNITGTTYSIYVYVISLHHVYHVCEHIFHILILEYGCLSVRPCPSRKKKPRANILSNGWNTIKMVPHYPITDPWVTLPERTKGAKDEVKRPKRPPSRRFLVYHIYHIYWICSKI